MMQIAQNPTSLLTPGQREQLLVNGRQSGRDHVPVVKFFNPVGIGTLAQLTDAPELGSFSLAELATLVLPFGMHIERDLLFSGAFPISAYAEAARETGSINGAIRVLANAARAARGERA